MAKPVFTSLSTRLGSGQVPFIIAGPMLRRVTPDEVNVWVALRKPSANLKLDVLDKDTNGTVLFSSAPTATIPLGTNLHLACISAKKGSGQSPLLRGTIYFYKLWRDGKPFSDAGELLADASYFKAYFCLGTYNLPSFCLPNQRILSPQLAHGSCRKPHAKGLDSFIKLDYLLNQHANKPLERPQLLCLTGDQIYADDVEESLLWFLMDATDALLPTWDERSVFPNRVNNAANVGTNQFYASNLTPGFRDKIMGRIGFTSEAKVCKNHLMTLGEFCMMYLFAWSPTLWPTPTETAKMPEVSPSLHAFGRTVWMARRAMANIPTYMCFDDHDITDDWFFDYAWCNRTLDTANPAARRVIANGMTAYSLFQMWGNLGSQFFQNNSFFQDLPSKFGASGRPDWTALENKFLPKILTDANNVRRLEFSQVSGSPFCFALDFPDFQIFFLDTRTQRSFPPGNLPPALIHPPKISGQLMPVASGTQKLTFVVSPAPVFETEVKTLGQELLSEGVFDWKTYALYPTLSNYARLKKAIVRGDRLEYDYETWKGNPVALSKLLQTLADFKTVVILSGDVHYGFSLRVSYWEGSKKATFLQACSSAFKNSLAEANLKVAAAYQYFDSDPDTVTLAAKSSGGVITLGSDFKLSEILWQCLQEPVGDYRTASQRGLLPPATGGKTGKHLLATLQKSQMGWDSLRYLVWLNNAATLNFGPATFYHDLQYMPNLNAAAVKNLTEHFMSLDLPDDSKKPIKI